MPISNMVFGVNPDGCADNPYHCMINIGNDKKKKRNFRLKISNKIKNFLENKEPAEFICRLEGLRLEDVTK